MFVAGPAIKKTRIAPKENPFSKNIKANGIEAVAHIYIGNETNNIINMPNIPPPILIKLLSGMIIEINADKSRPTISGLKISRGKRTKP